MAQLNTRGKSWYNPVMMIAAFAFFLFFFLLGAMTAHAETPAFTEANIIRSILGEARGEGYVAMYAHACAIRNRKNLSGVFGATAQMEPISADLRNTARIAWLASANQGDSVRGATHWLSDYDIKHCKSWRVWIADYKAVARVGSTTFYKRR